MTITLSSRPAASIFEKTVLRRSARVPRAGFVKLGIECEIAVELAHDLMPAGTPIDRESAEKAVGAVMAMQPFYFRPPKVRADKHRPR